MFTFRLTEVNAGAYTQALFSESRTEGGGAITYTHIFAGPSIGLSANGSVYHPNFMSYSFTTDMSVGYAYDAYGGNASGTREELMGLGTLGFGLNILPGKPYTGSAFLNYDNTYREIDFFNTILVESLSYGSRAQWSGGPWRTRAYFAHREEDSESRYPVNRLNGTEQIDRYTSRENTLTFDVTHERDRGQTSAMYSWNQYRRADFGQTGDGVIQTVVLSDTERLDPLGRFRLSTGGSYSWRDELVQPSDEATAHATFNAEHRPNLTSSYSFSYDHQTFGDFESENFSGDAQLTHRLYESLASGLTVRGSSFESTDRFSEGSTLRYGAGISEAYTKRLGNDHRLRLEGSVFVEHTDQSRLGTVINERHSILAGGEPGAPEPFSFVLNLPNVNLFTIFITDQTDRPPGFLQGFDYSVRQDGSRTVITWLRPPGPNTPTVVLVDYEAEPTPSGSYETISQHYLARLDLWKDLLGVYARLNISDNNAERELHVLEFVSAAFGADVRWRNFRAGGEYQTYDSTESDYSTIRLYQSVGFRPDEFSSLKLDLNEQWITYKDTDREESDYRFMLRYDRRMSQRLTLALDAGVAYRTGFGVDQLLAAVRPSIRYVIGRLTVESGYDFQQEIFLNREERLRHMLYLRLKRIW